MRAKVSSTAETAWAEATKATDRSKELLQTAHASLAAQHKANMSALGDAGRAALAKLSAGVQGLRQGGGKLEGSDD